MIAAAVALLSLLACSGPSPAALVDEDCDGVVAGVDCDDLDPDATLPQTWYTDEDGDGYGQLEGTSRSCDAPALSSARPGDCDDGDPAVNPAAQEVCGGRDEDCDGRRDDEDDDVGGASPWYADEDGDGVGGEPLGEACEQDGVTTGGDCDDTDPRRAADCSTCSHVPVDSLAAVARMGIADVLVDVDCFTYLSTVLTTDYVQLVHPSGLVVAEFDTWDGITDLPAMALDPDDGDLWVLGVTASGNAPMIGRLQGDSIEKIADGTYTLGASWLDVYLNRNAQSIASDGACVWAPNFAGSGTLVCVMEDGTQSTLLTLPERIESVAIAPDGGLYASAGATIYRIDGDATPAWSFDHTVLDFTFAPDGSVYVETTGDEILRVFADEDEPELFDAVEYDGKLIATEDGALIRLMPYWNGGTADVASLWQEWSL